MGPKPHKVSMNEINPLKSFQCHRPVFLLWGLYLSRQPFFRWRYLCQCQKGSWIIQGMSGILGPLWGGHAGWLATLPNRRLTESLHLFLNNCFESWRLNEILTYIMTVSTCSCRCPGVFDTRASAATGMTQGDVMSRVAFIGDFPAAIVVRTDSASLGTQYNEQA